ncbi:hypothetical protein GE21DRAFT_1018686 [Neurospora crassa]|nr:hypothetical protein GE21DRAFT_1018686 [Neurospora crassa]
MSNHKTPFALIILSPLLLLFSFRLHPCKEASSKPTTQHRRLQDQEKKEDETCTSRRPSVPFVKTYARLIAQEQKK